MISTLRVNNGSPLNIGSVVVQAQDVVTSTIAAAKAVAPASLGSAPLLTRQVVLPTTVLQLSNDKLQTVSSPSLSLIAGRMTTDATYVIPLGSKTNVVMPTQALTLDAGKVYDPRTAVGLSKTTRTFQPYEQLTGISQERPEVVMVMDFQPIIDGNAGTTTTDASGAAVAAGADPTVTAVGEFMDVQFSMRAMRNANVQSLVASLKSYFPALQQAFDARNQLLTDALASLNDDASFLLNLVRIIETQKSQLDLRHDVYLVDPNGAAQAFVNNYSQQQMALGGSPTAAVTALQAVTGHKPSYSPSTTLVDLGYSTDAVQNVFASSKLWLQLLLELKLALQSHTLAFIDIDPAAQRSDNNATTILNPPNVVRFDLAANLPQLPPLSELINVQPLDAYKYLNVLGPAFQSIYQNVFFKDEEARITALAHLLSREYRYSYGLSLPPVVAALRDSYGFNVVPSGNTSVFDAIVGVFGNNITDFPSQQAASLASLAQQQTGNTGVLTFETKYVVGDTGTLTPGGEYLFDQVLSTDGTKFDTTNVDALTSVVTDMLSSFSVIVDGMNLVSVRNLAGNPHRAGLSSTTGAGILATTTDVLTQLTQLVDANGVTLPNVATDRLGAVYSQARLDNGVKTVLFLYTMCKISRSYTSNVPFFTASTAADNTPIVDALVDQLNLAIQRSVPGDTQAVVQLLAQQSLDPARNGAALTSDSIRSSLKSGTTITGIVEQFMSAVLQQFTVKTAAMTGGYSVYGGFIDTVVAMVAFDYIISLVARYSNQRLVGYTLGRTVANSLVTYVVSQTTTSNRGSVNELKQRALGEDVIVQQMIWTVTTALTALAGSLRSISNYLKSPPAIQKLQAVASILDNDPDTIKMFFSEQQIMLLASTVQSMVAATSVGTTTQPATSPPTPTSTTTDPVVVLDESAPSSPMNDAVFGYLGSGDLATAKAFNKRIMTVGIPLGFTQRLKQVVSIQDQKKASFSTRRSDIVQVVVYKTDMQNPDIIYRPIRFLFELSRFPVRCSTAQFLPIPQQATQQDVINAVPTKCFTQDPDAGTAASISSGVEYASADVAGNNGVKAARAAFDDDAYSFLTTAQKAEILQNHVASQVLDTYVRLLTGLDVSEQSYALVPSDPLVETSFIKTLIDHTMQYVSDAVKAPSSSSPSTRTLGLLFNTTTSRSTNGSRLSNAAGTAGSVSPGAVNRGLTSSTVSPRPLEQQQPNPSVDASLNAVTPRYVPATLEFLRTVSGLANMLSTVSSADAVVKKVLSPKLFDRVFNLLFDASDFEIDVGMTTSTPYGTQALALMIRNGDIVEASQNDVTTSGVTTATPGSPAGNVNSYQYRPRDKNQGDLVADKYFVTVETLDEATQ